MLKLFKTFIIFSFLLSLKAYSAPNDMYFENRISYCDFHPEAYMDKDIMVLKALMLQCIESIKSLQKRLQKLKTEKKQLLFVAGGSALAPAVGGVALSQAVEPLRQKFPFIKSALSKNRSVFRPKLETIIITGFVFVGATIGLAVLHNKNKELSSNFKHDLIEFCGQTVDSCSIFGKNDMEKIQRILEKEKQNLQIKAERIDELKSYQL